MKRTRFPSPEAQFRYIQSRSAELFRGRSWDIVNQIIHITSDLFEYWPLTVRQVYYQLVAKQVIDNIPAEYQNVDRILVRLREEEILPWKAFQDRSRRLIEKRMHTDLSEYVWDTLMPMFDGYDRCLVQNQENYVEVWTEKDALSSLFSEAVHDFCCPVGVVRGQIGADFLNNYAIRAKAAIERGQKAILLYFGDLDPTGFRIPESIRKMLEKRYDDLPVEVRRVALWPKQVQEYNLPNDPTAAKRTDKNYEWYVNQGLGKYSVELDSLNPKDLRDLVDGAFGSVLDFKDMLREQKKEYVDRNYLERMKKALIQSIEADRAELDD